MDDPDDDEPISPDLWRDWYTERERTEAQMRRQSQAAGPPQVEWYFAEEGPALYFDWYARQNGLDNIHVFYMPIEYLKKGIVSPWLHGPAGSEFVPWSIYRTFANKEASQ
jgi:hypothetical protein